MTSPANIQSSSLARRLTTQDSSFIYGESFHGPMHIGSVNIFDGELRFDDVMDHLQARLHLIPRYRQRLNFVPFNLAHATWEDDPNFDLRNHVFHHRLTGDGSEREFTEAALRFHEQVMDRNKPLWTMHLFDGLSGGRTGMLWDVHHAMIDGVSGIELTTVMLDFQAESVPPDPPEHEWQPERLPTPTEAIQSALIDLAQLQLDGARRQADLMRRPDVVAERTRLLTAAARSMFSMATQPVVAAPWNRPPITSRRQLAWSKHPFGEYRGIRGVFGGTVNDVVLAVLSEGAARYLADTGTVTAGRSIRIGCPVNVRRAGESGALGNRVSMMFPALPAEPMGMPERLAAVRAETERIKEAQEPQGLEIVMESSDAVAPSLMGLASAAATATMDAAVNVGSLLPQLPAAPPFQPPQFGINFVATNVPGVQVQQYLNGKRLTDSIGLMPLGGNLGYGVAIGSYNQNMYLGMMGEPRVVDVDRMKGYVDSAYDDLKSAALAASEASA